MPGVRSRPRPCLWRLHAKRTVRLEGGGLAPGRSRHQLGAHAAAPAGAPAATAPHSRMTDSAASQVSPVNRHDTLTLADSYLTTPLFRQGTRGSRTRPVSLPGVTDHPHSFDPQAPYPDAELPAVFADLRDRDPDGVRIAKILRRTYDMLLDGQHTGRYRWDQLHKTEKTHFGTLVEINLQRAFGFDDGMTMDFAIRGIDVDCKYSQNLAEWMIPPEAVGHIILGLWASDNQGKWSLGLIRATDEVLTVSGGNRNRKRWLSATRQGGSEVGLQRPAAPGERFAEDPSRGCRTDLHLLDGWDQAGGHAIPARAAAADQPYGRCDHRPAGRLHEAYPR